jgi:hypothetical protein
MDDERKKELRRELLKRELADRESRLKPQGFLERAGIKSLGRTARDLAGGYAQGLANIVPGLGNLGISGLNALLPNRSKGITELVTGDNGRGDGLIPHIPMIDMVPHSTAATIGEIGSFFGAPGFLKAISKTPELVSTVRHAIKIPMVADAIKYASNILGKSPTATRIGGNALLGGAYTPENPLLGLGLGAAGGAIGEGIGKVASNVYNAPSIKEGLTKTYNEGKNALANNELLQKAYAKINPAAHAKELEHHLSQGANNITENSRLLAQDIRNAHNMREEEAAAYYNYALKTAGNEPIYGVGHRDIFPTKVPEYSRQQNTLNKIRDLKVGDLFKTFESNQTFENAHRLQSELGSMERKLNSNLSKTQDDIVQIKKINQARQQLKEDIHNGLEKRDLTSNHPVVGHYKKGSELYQTNVAPYLSDTKLIDIVKGGQTAVKDLHSVFDTPSNTVTKEGIEKIGSINKIMHDLSENSKMRIIFDAIGGNKLSAKALIQKLDEIKSKGFESYFTPEIEESINALGKKLRNKKYATVGAGLVGAHEANKLVNLF